MLIRVAKRNITVYHRKQRDYPWNNLAEFLQGDQTPDTTIAQVDAKVIDDIIQEKFKTLLEGKNPSNTTILDRVPYNGFHQSHVLSLEQYLLNMSNAQDMYYNCNDALAEQDHGFFGTEEYIKYRQDCLVANMEVPEFSIGFTFMLRPFIFDGQFDDLWHAGSMYEHTSSNPNGWFYQLKYKPLYE